MTHRICTFLVNSFSCLQHTRLNRSYTLGHMCSVQLLLLLLCTVLVSTKAAASDDVTKSWSIAEFGTPLYDETLTHWPYVNPDAPKGGSVVLGAFGSFDSLNTYILKGLSLIHI